MAPFIFLYLLSIYIIKIPKIFILLLSSLSDLTLASGREGIDNPFIVLVARFLFVCVGTRWLACGLLLDWYLGSQKLREILTLLYCTTLSSSRENQRNAQEVARRISGAVAGEIYAKSRHTKYPPQLLSFALHYLPFASRFPLPHFTIAVLFVLSFPFASLFRLLLVFSAAMSENGEDIIDNNDSNNMEKFDAFVDPAEEPPILHTKKIPNW